MNKILRLILTGILLITLNGQLNADTSKKPSNSFGVSPVENTINIKPGESSKETITIFNTTDQKLTINVSLIDVFYNKEGKLINMPENLDENNPEHLSIIKDASDANLPKITLRDWVGFSETIFSLGPNQEKEFNFIYSIPKNAKNGPHWGRLVFIAKEENQGNTIEVRKAAAVNLILRVVNSAQGNDSTQGGSEGEITEGKFNIQESKLGDILIFSFGYKTNGTDFAYPKGTISIEKKQSNGEYIKIYNNEAPLFRAFPNSVKNFDVNLNEFEGLDLKIGEYKLILSIDDLKGGKLTSNYPFTIKGNDNENAFVLNDYYIYIFIGLVLIILVLFIFKRKNKNSDLEDSQNIEN